MPLDWPSPILFHLNFLPSIEFNFSLSINLIEIALQANAEQNRISNAVLCNFSFMLDYLYIHDWSLQPFSQDCNLASHITSVVCVSFIEEWQDLEFQVDSKP